MKSKLWLALIAGFAFACSEKAPDKPAPAPAPKVAAAPKQDAPKGCSDCKVEIPVEAGCKVGTPSPDPILVAPGVHPIQFKITGAANAKFDSNGIDFTKGKNPNKDPDKVFPKNEHSGGGSQVYNVKDHHDDPPNSKGPFKYQINIVVDGKKCSKDPSVDNE